MAVPPISNEAFLREVDDELRRDELQTLWQRYGRLAIALVVGALALFGGWLWYRDHQAKQAGLEGEKLSAAFDQLASGNTAAASPELATLAQSRASGYRAAALMTQADIAIKDGKPAQAADLFGRVANDTSIAQPFRDMALVRQVTTVFDTLPPAEVIARLSPLVKPENAFFGSAGELVALAHMKAGRPREAATLLKTIADDKNVPPTLRERAGQLAVALEAQSAPATGTPAR